MNNALPDTRYSLIMRLPLPDQQQAWHEFVEIYHPFLYRFMRRRGLDDAAAQDVVQRVLVSVMKSVEKWVPKENGPKFRSWLFTIARNHLINERKKHLREMSVGGINTLTDLQLIEQASSDSHDESLAYRKEAILFAASRVRSQMESKTWQAFWKTTIESQSCQSVAQELQMDVASVYAARSRTLRKIREQIQLMLECDHEI